MCDLARLRGLEDDVATSWQLRPCLPSGDSASTVRAPFHQLAGGDVVYRVCLSGGATADVVVSLTGAAPGELRLPI